MKFRLTAYALVLMTALITMPSIVYGQNGPTCSDNNIAGNYSFTCSGWIAAGTGGALVPMMQVGMATSDADGNWSGFSTINIGGQTVVPNATVVGKTNVNANCTGNIVYNKGTATELNINYVVNLKTNEIFGLIINPGTVASCTLKRMSQ